MNVKRLTIAAVLMLAFIVLESVVLVGNARAVEESRILDIDFSSEEEALRHLDTTTENYDAGSDGSSKGYVDSVNGWYVFEGNNTNANVTGYDEALAVVQGYGESDGYGSYVVMPYNYSVEADFMVPASPGYGNFYVLPRYMNVDNKYEVVVDSEWNTLAFNYIKDGSWSSLKSTWFGNSLVIEKSSWYRLIVTISWEYNEDQGRYMNHIVATVVNLSDPTKNFTDDVWDDNLPPNKYFGLAFLGFDDDKEFKVYMDNAYVKVTMQKIFEEQGESISPSNLDVSDIHVVHDDFMIYFRFSLENSIQVGDEAKYWVLQLDVDGDSRVTENEWDYEYSIITEISANGSVQANLYDGVGNWIKRIHILGGGIGSDYLVVEVNKSDIEGLGDFFFTYIYSQYGVDVKDGFPRDDASGSSSGDYIIYYLTVPTPSSLWFTQYDKVGDGDPGYLDIISVSSAYSTDLLFFNLTCNGGYPWYGGAEVGIYRIYMDVDNDVETGYSFGSIGADYMLEHVVGYIPKLWRYNGSGSDWSWEFLVRTNYLYNPGGESSAIYVVLKSDLTGVGLGDNAAILAQSGQGDGVVDDTAPLSVPVPETLIIVVASILIVLVSLVTRCSSLRYTYDDYLFK